MHAKLKRRTLQRQVMRQLKYSRKLLPDGKTLHKKNLRWKVKVAKVAGAPNGSFRGTSVRKALNRLRYSHLIAVKAGGFFG